jgi:hypothetical protein
MNNYKIYDKILEIDKRGMFMQNIKRSKLVSEKINCDNISIIFDSIIGAHEENLQFRKALGEEDEQFLGLIEQSAYFNFNSVINAICDVISYFENKKFVVEKTSLVHTVATGGMLKPLYASDALILISSSEIANDKYYIDFELDEKIKNKQAIIIDVPLKINIDDYENYMGTYDGDDKIIKFIDDSSEFIKHHKNIIEVFAPKFDSFECAKEFIKYLRGYKIKAGNQELLPEMIETLKLNFINEYIVSNDLNMKRRIG